jgi:sterol desaturase/sphingolipid hydroxylase (fatty acid hydroxylase superfamily)
MCLANVLFNQLFINAIPFFLFEFNQTEMNYQTIPLVYLIEEFGFYWTHRLFHTLPFLWKLHQVHHRWLDTVPFSALDCHPVEHAVVNVFPLLLGPWIFQWTYTWTFAWVMLATINTLKAHLSRNEAHHTIHHQMRVFNYGLSNFTDILFHTRYDPVKTKEKQKQINGE